MKQKLLILMAAITFAAAASAQEAKKMYVVQNGKVTFVSAVSSIDSITFYNPDPLHFDEGVVINGVRWATRNLDVGGVFVANPEDYGALYQWGRRADGHESRTSPNYPHNDNSVENGVVSGIALDANGQVSEITSTAYGKFIKQNASPYDWRSPQDDALWNSGTEAAPVKTANDPCPAGWRVPTSAELQKLVDAGGVWKNTAPYGYIFGSGTNTLFLPAAGYRSRSDGTLGNAGWNGYYWSAAANGADYAYFLRFDSDGANRSLSNRPYGFSVRCVAE